MTIDPKELVDDALVFPVHGHPVHRTLVTSRQKVDDVVEINDPSICVVTVNQEKWSIELPFDKVVKMVYGAARLEEVE